MFSNMSFNICAHRGAARWRQAGGGAGWRIVGGLGRWWRTTRTPPEPACLGKLLKYTRPTRRNNAERCLGGAECFLLAAMGGCCMWQVGRGWWGAGPVACIWCMNAAEAETNKRTNESASVQRNKQQGTWIKLSARVHYFNATWRSLVAIATALSWKWSLRWSGLSHYSVDSLPPRHFSHMAGESCIWHATYVAVCSANSSRSCCMQNECLMPHQRAWRVAATDWMVGGCGWNVLGFSEVSSCVEVIAFVATKMKSTPRRRTVSFFLWFCQV